MPVVYARNHMRFCPRPYVIESSWHGSPVPSENSVLIESVDLIGCRPVGYSIPCQPSFWSSFLPCAARSRAALQAEILALRHQLLAKDAPIHRPIQPPAMGRVIELPQVGGLHHRYERQAA